MRHDFYDDPSYKKLQSILTRERWQLGQHDSLKKPLQNRICQNSKCKAYFQSKPTETKKFCSYNCAAYVNNVIRRHKREFGKVLLCENCRNLRKAYTFKYCSLQCQADARYKNYIERWKEGIELGVVGITTLVLSRYIKRYLFEKHGNRCSRCGWNTKNPFTNLIPIE